MRGSVDLWYNHWRRAHKPYFRVKDSHCIIFCSILAGLLRMAELE